MKIHGNGNTYISNSLININTPPNNSQDKGFKQRFIEADKTEISVLLDILQNHYEQIPDNLLGSFNSLKKEFINQPNLNVEDWKAKFLVWLSNLKFEIKMPELTPVFINHVATVMPDNFKNYYIQSLEIIAKLPINVNKTGLIDHKEHYTQTLVLYLQYEHILFKYNQYTTERLGVELEFPRYKPTKFVETPDNFQNETVKINQTIIELRNFLIEINDPKNQEGLYVAIVGLTELNEETKYLKLFKQFITALNKQEVVCYDYVSSLDIEKLAKEIKDNTLKESVIEFWGYVKQKHESATGLAKKAIFVSSLLSTQEVRKNLDSTFKFLLD